MRVFRRSLWGRRPNQRRQDPPTVPLLVIDALRPGESVLWTGTPRHLWAFEPADYFALVAGAAWLVLMPFTGSYFFRSDRVVFLLGVGFYMVPLLGCAGVVITHRISRRHVTYVLTSSRAFAATRLPRLRLDSRELVDCAERVFGRRRNGAGTLSFVRSGIPVDQLGWIVAFMRRQTLDFANVNAVQELQSMVHGALQSSS